MYLERPTRLHALDNADQAIAHLVLSRYPPRRVLFGDVAGVQIENRPIQPPRLRQRGVNQYGRPFHGIGFEVLEQHPIGRQVALHTVRIRKLPQVAAKDQPVETVQNAEDKMPKNS